MTDKETLIALRLEQNEVMTETLKKHARTLHWMRGDPIEPVAHTAEAILVGVGGIGTE